MGYGTTSFVRLARWINSYAVFTDPFPAAHRLPEVGKQVLARIAIGQNYSAYGIVGAFIALMAWIYYASILFFVGAQIVRVKYRLRKNGEAGPGVG